MRKERRRKKSEESWKKDLNIKLRGKGQHWRSREAEEEHHLSSNQQESLWLPMTTVGRERSAVLILANMAVCVNLSLILISSLLSSGGLCDLTSSLNKKKTEWKRKLKFVNPSLSVEKTLHVSSETGASAASCGQFISLR